MSEQGKFLEELEAVKSIAASQDNKKTGADVVRVRMPCGNGSGVSGRICSDACGDISDNTR